MRKHGLFIAVNVHTNNIMPKTVNYACIKRFKCKYGMKRTQLRQIKANKH